jgi:high affinity Mn2+ porin
MASYLAAIPILRADGPGADISAARAYRYKYGFGVNWEQEVAKTVGMFSRLGWTDGRDETWTFTDADWTASLGARVAGEEWRRPHDTVGLAGVVSGASRDNQEFLEAGGLDMLDGDGALHYGPEKVLETYYDTHIWKSVHVTLDYQFVTNPAFNRDRGPVSIFGVRLHWEI